MSDRQLLTPPPSPPRTLPNQINAATRTPHTRLNRLITSRIPLALPPYRRSTLLFGQGLRVFGEIYFIFEGNWAALSEKVKFEAGPNISHDLQVQQWLATTIPRGLPRSSRLLDDLLHIARSNGDDHQLLLTQEQREITKRMEREIQAKPHILLAYSWVMYMAVFSGGRWIRQELLRAGPRFWMQQVRLEKHEKGDEFLLDLPGFTFLSFDGDEDGEDIKVDFKTALAEADTLLTDQERQDIIQASQQLFQDCIDLIEMLDRSAGNRWLFGIAIPLAVSVAIVVQVGVLYWYDTFG